MKAYQTAAEQLQITPVTLREDISINFEGQSVNIDAPASELYKNNPSNNSSLITYISCDDYGFLFMADAEKLRLQEFLAENRDLAGKLILKMPHHGEYYKLMNDLLERYNPINAIICADRNDPDQQEKIKTADLLKKYNVPSYYTFNGEISITVGENGLQIHQ